MRGMVLVVGAGLIALGTTGGFLSPAYAQDMQSVRTACAAMGLNPSEAPFAYCVRSLAQSAPAQNYAMNASNSASDATPYRPGFTGTGISHDARSACAAIGLNPATARFSYCVGNLRATLFDSQRIDTQ